jgi:hypothetical protein
MKYLRISALGALCGLLVSCRDSGKGDLTVVLQREIGTISGRVPTAGATNAIHASWTIQRDGAGVNLFVDRASFAAVHTLFKGWYGEPASFVARNTDGNPQALYNRAQTGLGITYHGNDRSVVIHLMKPDQY